MKTEFYPTSKQVSLDDVDDEAKNTVLKLNIFSLEKSTVAIKTCRSIFPLLIEFALEIAADTWKVPDFRF